MLKLRAPLSADDLVIAHADGSIVQAIYVSQHWARTIRKPLAIRIFRTKRDSSSQIISGVNVEATTRIELVYTVLQTVA